FARRAKHADALDAALRSDEGELLLAGKLARLREVGVLGELMARAEQRFDMLRGEMNVMRRNLDHKWLLLLGLERAGHIGTVPRAQRLMGHHALFVRRHDEHGHLRVVRRAAALLA